LFFAKKFHDGFTLHTFSGQFFADFRVTETTAAAAGAVCIIRNQRLVSLLNHQDIVGPAARHFCLFSVFCGLNFRVLSSLFVVT
jgi:hypothetical protein